MKKQSEPTKEELTLENLHQSKYGWPLNQLRIPEAHEIIRGSSDVIIAVIDIGYLPHPSHESHLWNNPSPSKGDIHGWDFEDDDASLEYRGRREDAFYNRAHHSFIVGEVITCAPLCPVMVLRVGYENPESWGNAIEYAVDHGAGVIVLPHGFISHGSGAPYPLFYMGTDFGYPVDNPKLRRSFDRAYEADCLICKGTADNRGRRVASAIVGHDAVFPIGSSNRRGEPSDTCPSTDYALAATPGGERGSDDEVDFIWSTGVDGAFVSFTGGCMASGFAGGTAALVKSRFPDLTIEELKMVLRNTAAAVESAAAEAGKSAGDAVADATASKTTAGAATPGEATGAEWNPQTGYGILDAARAVSLDPGELCQLLRVNADSASLGTDRTKALTVDVRNDGAYDVRRAIVVAYDGNPLTPADPDANRDNPKTLLRKQIGHAITPVRGLHSTTFTIDLASPDGFDPDNIYLQVASLDHHGSYEADTVRLRLR